MSKGTWVDSLNIPRSINVQSRELPTISCSTLMIPNSKLFDFDFFPIIIKRAKRQARPMPMTSPMNTVKKLHISNDLITFPTEMRRSMHSGDSSPPQAASWPSKRQLAIKRLFADSLSSASSRQEEGQSSEIQPNSSDALSNYLPNANQTPPHPHKQPEHTQLLVGTW